MAQKSKKSTKKLSFRKTSPLKMLLAVIVVTATAGIGTYLLTRSNAATVPYPPVELRQNRYNSAVKAVGTFGDNAILPVFCTSAQAKAPTSLTGPLSICTQFKDNGFGCGLGNQIRVGSYNTTDKTFYPKAAGWMNASAQPCKGGYSETEGMTAVMCKNIPRYFVGVGRAESAYGQVDFGQIYRLYAGKWQIRYAVYSMITQTCSTNTNDIWINATTWGIAQ